MVEALSVARCACLNVCSCCMFECVCPDRPRETMRGLARVILVCSYRYCFICRIVKLRQREHARGRGCGACACLACFQTECASLKCASAYVCRFHEPSYAHFLLVCTLRATFEASVLLIRGTEGRETHSAMQARRASVWFARKVKSIRPSSRFPSLAPKPA